MPGPPKSQSSSAKKIYFSKYRKDERRTSVNILKAAHDWNILKREIGASSHEKLAKLLIECYRDNGERKRKRPAPPRSASSNSAESMFRDIAMSGLDPLPSDTDPEIAGPSTRGTTVSTSTPVTRAATAPKSDIELSGVSAVPSEQSEEENLATGPKGRKRSLNIRPSTKGTTVSTSTPVTRGATAPNSDIELSGVSAIPSEQSEEENLATGPKGPKRSLNIRFELSESEEDAGAFRDADDPTFMPTESDWDMSILVPEPEGMDVVPETALEQQIHDIPSAEVEELPMQSGSWRKLQRVDVADEEERMVMVSHSALCILRGFVPHRTCSMQTCKKETHVHERYEGCGVKLKWVCDAGHESYSWASQPVLPNGVLLGNIQFASSIVLSGNNYAKVNLMCRFMRVGLPSQTMFYKLQSNYLVPVVDSTWTEYKLSAQEEHRAAPGLVIAGDGRMDSPGHCAKYCTYTIMNQADKKILAMEVVDKREVQLKSNNMETKGFERALADLKQSGITPAEIVTDAHPQISSIMKKQFPQVKHSWDMWHGAKNMGKKLGAVASDKGNSLLKPWISDITNHFYYSAEHCNGVEFILKNKFISVLHHCANEHKWALGQCDHDVIDEDAERGKDWLKQSGSEMSALRKVLLAPRFLNSLGHYVTCQTTSELESFNNHLLMYVSKRQAFTFPVYRCRCQLAAIDYMYHLDRPRRKTKQGNYYYSRQWSKAANHWTFKYVKVEKTYKYIPKLLLQIANTYCAEHKTRPLYAKAVMDIEDPRHIARTIAPQSPPATADIVASQKSRLEKTSSVQTDLELH